MVLDTILTFFIGLGYLLQIVGTLISALGALIVRYPDMPDGRLRSKIGLMSKRARLIEDARDSFYANISVTDDDEVQVIEDIFEDRYGETRYDNPEKVTSTSTAIRIEYPNNSKSSPFKDRETGKIEKRQFFDWGLRRQCTQTGMLYIVVGFSLLFVSALLAPL